MDLETFYGHLGTLRANGFRPFFHEDGWIRLIHTDNPLRHFCPLTAVCLLLTGMDYRTAAHRAAAHEIDLKYGSDANRVQLAADKKEYPEIRKILLHKPAELT